ncbi:unnamed protein product [Rotaria magnacalcarata]
MYERKITVQSNALNDELKLHLTKLTRQRQRYRLAATAEDGQHIPFRSITSVTLDFDGTNTTSWLISIDRTVRFIIHYCEMTERNTLTLSEKIQLIREHENNVSCRVLVGKYKISIGSVSKIIKRKIESIEDFENNENSNKKRNLRDEISQQVDQQVYEWFVEQRSKNIPISGPLLQERARQIRQQLGGAVAGDFKASNGWLEKFQIRHNIHYRVISGESASVDLTTVEEWKKRLPLRIDQYDPHDVYNADETGLFFKALPDRSLVMAKEKCKGGKKSKERFTVLLCTNMTGTDKLKPLVIGQYLVKYIISRCAVAQSCEDIVITALDAIYWTNNAWKAINQSTICNSFQTAGFKSSNIQSTTNAITDISTQLEQQADIDDISSTLQTLDMLLDHVKIDGECLSASEFVDMHTEIPVFNEWNDPVDKQIIIDKACRNQISNENNDDISSMEEEDDVPAELPPKLVDAMEMVRRLHLLATTEQPQLHCIISQLDSQLTQLFIDSKQLKHKTIEDFFKKK